MRTRRKRLPKIKIEDIKRAMSQMVSVQCPRCLNVSRLPPGEGPVWCCCGCWFIPDSKMAKALSN